ncbi:MAG: hypothetical protein VXW65_15030, partial [Pseudomonadota bacterium]|nr:hypothetical protein [Pseudomonadota bacterium]
TAIPIDNARSLASVASNLFAAVVPATESNVANSTSTRPNDNKPSSGQASVAKKLTSILDNMCQSLGAGMVPGQTAAELNTSSFAAAVQAVATDTIAVDGVALSAGTVQIPPVIPLEQAAPSLTAQVVRWVKNPYSYVPDDKAHLISRVVTVSLFNGSLPIVVKNLEDDIQIEVDVQTAANASGINCNLSCANAYDVAHGADACAQLLSESGYSCDAHFCPSCQYRNFCNRICNHKCRDATPINISECELPQEPRAAFWNTKSLEWHVGGTFNSSTQSKRAIVEFNHLTDFAVILDDPPATNKLASLRDTFDLSGWLQNNPVGLVLVVCFLTMIAIVSTKNQRLYMQRNGLCLADQPWWHCRCSRHESTELQQAA